MSRLTHLPPGHHPELLKIGKLKAIAKCANAQTPQQKPFTLGPSIPRATVGNDQLKGFRYAVHKRTYPLY